MLLRSLRKIVKSILSLKHKRYQQSGFTLIELVVTMTIFVFMTALIIGKYGSFNQSTLLTSLAYDVALTVRTAQTYGVSVKAVTEGINDPCSADEFQCAYGVHFTAPTAGGSTNTFTLYAYQITPTADITAYAYPGGRYPYTTPTANDINQYTVKRGGTVTDICIYDNVDPASGCSSHLVYPQSLDFIFKRPDSTAHVCTDSGASGGSVIDCSHFRARITISSADGTRSRGVVVYKNGQVAVED